MWEDIYSAITPEQWKDFFIMLAFLLSTGFILELGQRFKRWIKRL